MLGTGAWTCAASVAGMAPGDATQILSGLSVAGVCVRSARGGLGGLLLLHRNYKDQLSSYEVLSTIDVCDLIHLGLSSLFTTQLGFEH